ncbi:MAG: hypothetical protein M0R21_01570 [Lentimicrobiaceae bacterium]|nr:hypothetical protein [Lentimicrobiaceae bacterium]
MEKNDNYRLLIQKLDQFIRKYYKNQILRGAIYSTSTLLILYLLIVLLEYYGWLGIAARTILFYTFLLIISVFIVKFILFPFFKLLKIGKTITHDQAATIIGNHFNEVKDVLINTLELHELAENMPESRELIEAGINQKIERIRPFPFLNAIDFKKNKKYLKYAILPLIIIFCLLIAFPAVIIEPTNRIIHFNKPYEKKVPFTVEILNNTLQAVQQEDFHLKIHLKGEEIPAEVSIVIDGSVYKTGKDNTVNFHYDFKNVQKDIDFKLLADGFTSGDYLLRVFPKPVILSFEENLVYPAYIKKVNERVYNNGDLQIPEGTLVNWKFFTKDTRQLRLSFDGNRVSLNSGKDNTFGYSRLFRKSCRYSIHSLNQFINNNDSLFFNVIVIPDAYPLINVQEIRDSVYDNRLYFNGTIKDDYGFSNLIFYYKKDDKNKYDLDTLLIEKDKIQQHFFYSVDWSKLNIQPGDEITYYFEVSDNDAVNGKKKTKSNKMTYKLPSVEEMEKATEKSNTEIQNDIQKAIEESKLLQQKISELTKKLYDKKTLSWQDKKQLSNLLDKQKQIQERIEKINKENIEKSLREEQYNTDSDEILQKKKELERLFQEVLPDEMKAQIEDMKKLLEEANKKQVNDMLDKMKMSAKELEKELDRNLELFKQLQFEKKFEETIDKVKKLSDEQKSLMEETKKQEKDTDLINKQEEIKKNSDDISKDLKELQEKSKEQDQNLDLEKADEIKKEVDKKIEESLEKLNKNNNTKATKPQKEAAEKMDELSQELEKQMAEMEDESLSEDMSALREILENCIEVSFQQENLIKKTNKISMNDPNYLKIIQEQKNINDDFKMVGDSLTALSKRQIMIQPFILKELSNINLSQDQTLQYLEDRNTSIAATKQQYIMTSVNNLALLLNEALKQMQNQMNMQSSGKGKSKCTKPGAGKPSLKTMKQMQQQLNQQMEQMKQSLMKNGKEGKNSRSNSEQFARMAAEQEAIRKQLQELSDEMQKDEGGGNGTFKSLTNQMGKTEKDLVNKNISNETLKRQKEILTRMLESEKALDQREKDTKRESREADVTYLQNKAKYSKELLYKENDVEKIRTQIPEFKSFYKRKINEYNIKF